MKLLLDEQVSGKIAERLRNRSHDAVAVTAEPGLAGSPDAEIFETAQRQGRAVVTDQLSRLVDALDKLLKTFTAYPSFVTWFRD